MSSETTKTLNLVYTIQSALRPAVQPVASRIGDTNIQPVMGLQRVVQSCISRVQTHSYSHEQSVSTRYNRLSTTRCRNWLAASCIRSFGSPYIVGLPAKLYAVWRRTFQGQNPAVRPSVRRSVVVAGPTTDGRCVPCNFDSKSFRHRCRRNNAITHR